MTHVALLGDSIFDNKTYTNGEPDVVAHLRTFLPQTNDDARGSRAATAR